MDQTFRSGRKIEQIGERFSNYLLPFFDVALIVHIFEIYLNI